MHRLLWCLVAVAQASVASAADDEPSLAQYYGFQSLEAFKLSSRTHSLQVGDFNRDGRTDVVVVNNANHRLDLLLQRSTKPDQPGPAVDQTVNSIVDHWRFELVKVPVDYDIAALAVGDFNHDGRDDVACFGTPDQLVIRFQPELGPWTAKNQLRIPDVLPTQWCMAAGDMNHDGLDDIVILGKRDTVVLHQQPQGGFAPPVRLMNTSDKLGLAQAADLDGDGRADLCYVAGEATSRSLGVRMQDGQGRLGPEFLFDLEHPRGVTIKDVDGQPGSEILLIDSRTGRLEIFKVEFSPLQAGKLPEQLVRYGFGGSGSGRDRDWAIGDFDRDGRNDIAVSDPDGSQVLLFRQTPKRGLDLGSPFPSVAGADALKAWSSRKSTGSELVVQSTAEKAVGLSRWHDDRLTFPEALPIDVEPAGLEVLDVTGDGQLDILFLAKTKKGRESEFALWAYTREAGEGAWKALPNYPVPVSVRGTPERMLAADITGDGVPELLVLQGSKPPTVLRRKDDGVLGDMPVSGALSNVESVSGHAIFPCRWKGTAGILVPQDNFARLMTLAPEARWQVVEQFNASEGGAKIVGGAVLQLEAGGEPELALVDAGVTKLRLFKSGMTPWKEIDLGDLEFKSAAVADLNGDGHDDLALFGGRQLAVLYSGGISPQLKETASFETALEKTFLADVAVGDVNGDGRTDLVVTDTRSHYIEILQFRPPASVKHAMYFKLFEEKTLAGSETPSAEPREIVVADVTGDGRADLLILAHDRLLVYPQDPGQIAANAAK